MVRLMERTARQSMKVNTHKQITDLIQKTIANGDDIATLTRKISPEAGERNTTKRNVSL